MKKIFRLLSLILVLMFAVTLTGCSKDVDRPTREVAEGFVLPTLDAKEGYTFVGYFNEETHALYLVGAKIPAGKYSVILIEDSKVNTSTLTYSYPNLAVKGSTFAGWYSTSELKSGTRVTTNNSLPDDCNVIYARYINLADAGLVALVCIVIVFLMLALLLGIVSLFKFLPTKKEKAQKEVKTTNNAVSAPKKAFTMADITDDDMMAAALVATIEYHNETGENVRVVSIKQIG